MNIDEKIEYLIDRGYSDQRIVEMVIREEGMGWKGTKVQNVETKEVCTVVAETNTGTSQDLTLDNGTIITHTGRPGLYDDNGDEYIPV